MSAIENNYTIHAHCTLPDCLACERGREIERLQAEVVGLQCKLAAVNRQNITTDRRALSEQLAAANVENVGLTVERDEMLAYIATLEARCGEVDKAMAEACKYREQLERFEKTEPTDWTASSATESHLYHLAEARKEQIELMRQCSRRLLSLPNPGAPLLSELATLRTIASLSLAFCAETVGEEDASENGRLLNEALKGWREGK